jgi:hypothetical protein
MLTELELNNNNYFFAGKKEKEGFGDARVNADLSIPSDFFVVYKNHLTRSIQKIDVRSFNFVIDHFSNLIFHTLSFSNGSKVSQNEEFFVETCVGLFDPQSECSLFRLLICDYM